MRNNSKAGKRWERECIKSIFPIDNPMYDYVYKPPGEDHNNTIGRSGDRSPALDRKGIDIWLEEGGWAIQCKKQEGNPKYIDITGWFNIRTDHTYKWPVLLVKKMKKAKVKATTIAKLAVMDIKMFSVLVRLVALLPELINNTNDDLKKELIEINELLRN